MHVVHLEEEASNKEGDVESEDPDDIKGVTQEFTVHLARAVKDAQQEEKLCYHAAAQNISSMNAHWWRHPEQPTI